MSAKSPRDGKDSKVSDLTDNFVSNFGKLKMKIEGKIVQSQVINQDELPAHFNAIKNDVQELQKLISEATKFLPPFNVKVALDHVKSLVEWMELEQEKLLPKKKFAFKTKNRSRPPSGRDIPDSCTPAPPKPIPVNMFETGVKNLSNKTAEMRSLEINGKDVNVSSCTDSTIYLYGHPSTVHVSRLKNCRIFGGPVTTSIFVEDCSNCKFSVACQQLRVHSTASCDFYLHVTSRAIIEDCKSLRFAPYKWSYPDIESDFQKSGLSRNNNNWQEVDDFNWLSKDVPSPNWSIIENIGDAV